MWDAKDKEFVAEVKKVGGTDDLNDLFDAEYGGFTNQKFHNMVIRLLSKRTEDDEVLASLMVFYPIYRMIYRNNKTLSKMLSQVRSKAIHPYQSNHVWIQSTYDTFFNLSEMERVTIINDYKQKVQHRNRNQIEINESKLIATVKGLMKSENKYETMLAIMFCTGLRPVEVFSTATMRLSKNKGWAVFTGLAKQRGENRPVDRPVLIYSPRYIKKKLKNTRPLFDMALVVNGELNKAIQHTLNKKMISNFPFVDGLPNKSSMLRKLYGTIAYDQHAPDNMNLNIFLQDILGHKSVLTSFSYSVVSTKKKPERKTK